jgi:hypothetical protein
MTGNLRNNPDREVARSSSEGGHAVPAPAIHAAWDQAVAALGCGADERHRVDMNHRLITMSTDELHIF